MLKTAISVDELILQESEVSEAKLISVDEFKKMVEQGSFHNYGADYFETLLDAISAAEVID